MGASKMGEALKVNSTLTELILGGGMYSRGIGAGASMIGEALQVNTTLTKLNLESERVNEKSFKKYEKISKHQWTDNRIEDEGATKISEALKINTTLKTLNLDSDENPKYKIRIYIYKNKTNEKATRLEQKEP